MKIYVDKVEKPDVYSVNALCWTLIWTGKERVIEIRHASDASSQSKMTC